MKKLLAIAVVFALVAGAAFAETSIGGNVETAMYFLDYTKDGALDTDVKVKDSIAAGGRGVNSAFIQLSGTNDEGTMGGLFRWRNTDGGANFHRVFVWWRPIDQVELFLGIDNDGKFDTAQFTGWGFHQFSNDYIFNHHWDFWRGIFPGNWDGFGLAVSLYPFEGFNFNIVVPTGGLGYFQGEPDKVGASKEWEHLAKQLRFQGSYALDGIGLIQFAINLGDKDIYGSDGPEVTTGVKYGDLYTDYNHQAMEKGGHMGRYGLSFLLTAIDGMQILIGGSIIPYDGDTDMQINVGAGVAYGAEGWGVKFRAGANLQGDTKQFVNANVMPYFDVAGGQLMIDIGLSMELADEKKSGVKDNMGWYVTPGFKLPLGAGTFGIGIQLFSNIKMGGNIELNIAQSWEDDYDPLNAGKSRSTDVRFRIPVLFSFNF